MQTNPISILIVDDTKFSSAVIKKLLNQNGFDDIRVSSAAVDALSMIKERHVDILLADWLMPGMDGLALTQLVRELNHREHNFTYVILLTAKESESAFKEAFASGVDDFVGKTELKSHLLPRVHAAKRMTEMHNSVLQRESNLIEQHRSLSQSTLFDEESGAGNFVHMSQLLERYLQQSRSRDGNIGLLICRLDNLDDVADQDGDGQLRNSLLKQVVNRLKEVARPMDNVAKLNSNSFALAIYSNGPAVSAHNLLKRVEDSVLESTYPTDDGYISLSGSLQVDLIGGDVAGPENAQQLLNDALWRLSNLQSGQTIYNWSERA